jgi:D-beta-D-heptose 7-phosphate kinase/D-beta-D-heptose 1-phosphate adenosyltransferase
MTVVFTNGCFDILHPGHIEMLEYAKSLGDYLYVALDTDERVSRKKPGRPINNLQYRSIMMQALHAVDNVFCFSSDDDLRSLIKNYKPDIMVVGSDWLGKEIIGSEYAGEVKFYNRNPNFSTTDTINRIKSIEIRDRHRWNDL